MTEKKPQTDGLDVLWNDVARTDEADTKPVEYGARKFTAIEAHSQLKKATRKFGPLGGKWAWVPKDEVVEVGGGKIVRVRGELYHPHGERPVIAYGAARLTGDDAHKKADTDAFTKALSKLGFNADVFLGRFKWIDNKYVDTEPDAPPAATPAQVGRIQNLAATVYGTGAVDHVTDQLKMRNVRDFATLPEHTATRWITYLEARAKAKDAAPDPLPLNTEKEVTA